MGPSPLARSKNQGYPILFTAHREKGSRTPIHSQTGTAPESRPASRQPVHWGWLYASAFVAALSHLLLDWTNNYGLRPFFPLNPNWYAGSFMFIFEPVLYVLFFLAFFMPWVIGLTDLEIGVRRHAFRGRGWAIFALAAYLALGCWRWAEHAQAMAMVENTNIAAAPATRIAVEPYPVNPFRWHAILETADFYQTAEIDTRSGSIDSDPHRDVMYKPADTPAVEAAKQTLLGRVYLDWGTWAVVRDVGQEPVAGLDPPISLPIARGRPSSSPTSASIMRFWQPAMPGAARRLAAGSISSTAAMTRARLWPAACNGRFSFPSELSLRSASLVLQQLAGAFFPQPPPRESQHRQRAHNQNCGQRVARHQIDCARSQFEHQQRESEPAQQPSHKNGQQEMRAPASQRRPMRR